MSWSPQVGMLLRCQEAGHNVEVLSRRDLCGLVLWEVVLDGKSSVEERPWMVHEPVLLEKYEPVPRKP